MDSSRVLSLTLFAEPALLLSSLRATKLPPLVDRGTIYSLEIAQQALNFEEARCYPFGVSVEYGEHATTKTETFTGGNVNDLATPFVDGGLEHPTTGSFSLPAPVFSDPS